MFVFQVAQKSAQQGGAFQSQVRVFTGQDAQRLLKQGVMPACEQMLLKVHGV